MKTKKTTYQLGRYGTRHILGQPCRSVFDEDGWMIGSVARDSISGGWFVEVDSDGVLAVVMHGVSYARFRTQKAAAEFVVAYHEKETNQ